MHLFLPPCASFRLRLRAQGRGVYYWGLDASWSVTSAGMLPVGKRGFRCAATATPFGFHWTHPPKDLGHSWGRSCPCSDRGTVLLPRSTSGTRYGYPEMIIRYRTLLRLLRRFRLILLIRRSTATANFLSHGLLVSTTVRRRLPTSTSVESPGPQLRVAEIQRRPSSLADLLRPPPSALARRWFRSWPASFAAELF